MKQQKVTGDVVVFVWQLTNEQQIPFVVDGWVDMEVSNFLYTLYRKSSSKALPCSPGTQTVHSCFIHQESKYAHNSKHSKVAIFTAAKVASNFMTATKYSAAKCYSDEAVYDTSSQVPSSLFNTWTVASSSINRDHTRSSLIRHLFNSIPLFNNFYSTQKM